MSKSEVKPLELWVLKDATHDYLTWEPTRHTISDFHHMIDFSSYQALQKENEELKDKLKKADQDHYNIAWELEQYKNSNTNKVE